MKGTYAVERMFCEPACQSAERMEVLAPESLLAKSQHPPRLAFVAVSIIIRTTFKVAKVIQNAILDGFNHHQLQALLPQKHD